MPLRLRNKWLLCRLLVWSLFMALVPASPAVADRLLKPASIIPLWYPQPQFAGYYMAREKGIYEKFGLDVTILPGGSNRDPISKLKEGRVTFAILDLLWAMELKAQGVDIVNVAQIFQTNSIEFVVRKDSGITRFEDLDGRHIAIWKNRLTAQTMGAFQKHGITPVLFPVSDGLEFFLKQAVDSCAILHYSGYKSLINYGLDIEDMTVLKLSEIGLDFPQDGIYCMAETLDTDKDKIRRFVNASLEGWQYAMAHPNETIETFRTIRINNRLPANAFHLKWMMTQIKPVIVPADKDIPMGRLQKSDYDRAASFLIQTGRIKTAPTYDTFHFRGE